MSKYTLGPLFQQDFPITQSYGERPEYYAQFGLLGHEGVDFGTPNGTPFISPFNGIILRDTFNDKDYGNFTVVWDPIQCCGVWFCHLQDVTTQVGDKVTVGQVLGHTNNTGNTSGPHCHVNFVETDSLGNRLNRDNGYQGFLNIMDTNLVTIAGSNPVPTPPTPPTPPDPESDALNAISVLRTHITTSTDQSGNPFGNLEGYANTLTQDAYTDWKNYPSLDKKLSDANLEIAKQNQVISDLQNQLNNPPPLPNTPQQTGGFIAWLRSLFG